jgi:pyruvate kinase
MTANALQAVQQQGLVKEDDLVAITAGTAGSEPGTTNLLRIHVIQ